MIAALVGNLGLFVPSPLDKPSAASKNVLSHC